MWRLLSLALLLVCVSPDMAHGTVGLQDEAAPVSWGAAVLKCAGTAIACSKSGITGTISVSGSGLTGSGTANQLAYWTGTTALAGDSGFTVDATTDALTATGSLTGGDLRLSGNSLSSLTALSNILLNPASGGRLQIGNGSGEVRSQWQDHLQISNSLAGNRRIFFPAVIGTEWSLYNVEASSDLTLEANTASTENVNITNIGAGVTNLTIDGDLTITGDDLVMATNTSGAALIADGTNFNPVVISGDITIGTTGTATIGADRILESMLKAVDTSVDEECLTYETTTGDFEWQPCIATTIVDAKGDLIAGTAADTVARFAVGTNGQGLVADSSQTAGLRWANVAPDFSLQRLIIPFVRVFGSVTNTTIGLHIAAGSVASNSLGGMFASPIQIPPDMDVTKTSNLKILISPTANGEINGQVIRFVGNYTKVTSAGVQSDTNFNHDFSVPNGWITTQTELLTLVSAGGVSFAASTFALTDQVGFKVYRDGPNAADTYDQGVRIANYVIFEYTPVKP